MREYDVGGYQRAFNVGYCLGKLLSEMCIGHSLQTSRNVLYTVNCKASSLNIEIRVIASVAAISS
jgi:hypothetical protein